MAAYTLVTETLRKTPTTSIYMDLDNPSGKRGEYAERTGKNRQKHICLDQKQEPECFFEQSKLVYACSHWIKRIRIKHAVWRAIKPRCKVQGLK